MTVAAEHAPTHVCDGSEPDPHFVLSRPHGTVTAHGVERTVSDIHEAVRALRSGDARAVVGALPFDVREPAALTVPSRLHHTSSPIALSGMRTQLPDITVRRRIPTPDEHTRRIADTIALMHEGNLRKVVLARSVELEAADPIDHRSVLARLVDADPAGNGFSVDLSAAGADYTGMRLVGSSPEVLIRRSGRTVTCYPLAGSAARHHDPDVDAARGQALAASEKDLAEHAFVVRSLRTAVAPLCEDIDIPQRPILTSTPQLWHLGTPIRAVLRDPSVSALELALAVHPTPAVCGTPTDAAMRTILDLEGSRGFYAGALGWCDESGDGEWMVTIRCAQISADGRSVTAHAGGGIVEASNPESELDETSTKFRTIMAALGLLPH